MRTFLRRIGFAIAALAIVVAAGACSPQEEDAFRAVNTLRDEHGLRYLDWNEAVLAKAEAWSAHMADEGKLSHSNLADGVPAGWHTLGENVAYAGSVEQAMEVLEASEPHLANILNTAFTSVAIGVVERDGLVWVSEVFVG